MLGTPEYMAPEMAQGQTVDYPARRYLRDWRCPFPNAQRVCPFHWRYPYAVMIKHVQEPLPLLQPNKIR